MNNGAERNPFAPYELQIDAAQRKQIIAPLLVELRESKHMSQRQVAALLGVSPQTYNGWEKARNEPAVEYLVRLAYLYNISLDTLCGKSVFTVPTKENVSEMLNTYRAQIDTLQKELDSGKYDNAPEQRQQLQAMLDGLRAVVSMAAQSNSDRNQ